MSTYVVNVVKESKQLLSYMYYKVNMKLIFDCMPDSYFL